MIFVRSERARAVPESGTKSGTSPVPVRYQSGTEAVFVRSERARALRYRYRYRTFSQERYRCFEVKALVRGGEVP